MLQKFTFLWCVVFYIFFMDVAYCSETVNLENVLSPDNLLEKKLDYLKNLRDKKEGSVFFYNEEIKVILKIIDNRLDNKKEIEGIDEILTLICEILLKVNMTNVDQSLIAQLATTLTMIHVKIKNKEGTVYRPLPVELFFLRLKVLIKLNSLKLNSENQEYLDMVQGFFRALDEPEEITQKRLEEREEKAYKEWEDRKMVEGAIFDPVLIGYSSVKKEQTSSKKEPLTSLELSELEISTSIGSDVIFHDAYCSGLQEYEKYLSGEVKNFQINQHLKELVKQAFLKSSSEEIKLNYIKAMFFLGMEVNIIEILEDESIDSKFKEKVIDAGVRLLENVDILHFKKLMMILVKVLEEISSNSKSDEKLKTNIKIVQQYISKHDDVKDLEKILLRQNLSTEEKIGHLNFLLGLDDFSFSKDNLGWITGVLDSKDIDTKVKVLVSIIVFKKSRITDIFESLGSYDLESLGFLYWIIRDSNGINLSLKGLSPKDKKKVTRLHESLMMDDKVILAQYGRFNMWKELLEYIEDSRYSEDYIRKLAIKVSLELLSRTKDFEEFCDKFLKVLEGISKSPNESNELRNVVDFILLQVKKEGKNILKKGCCTFSFGI